LAGFVNAVMNLQVVVPQLVMFTGLGEMTKLCSSELQGNCHVTLTLVVQHAASFYLNLTKKLGNVK
jgi:hypothetical protein